MNVHKIFIFIGLLLVCFPGCDKEEKKKSEAEDAKQTLKYDVVGKEDVSYAGTPRMVFRVIAKTDSIPSESQLQTMAERIWRNGNKNWKEFTVFVYLPSMDTGGVAYGIGTFSPSGLRKFEVNDFTLYGTKWRPADQVEKQADQKWEKQKESPTVKEYSVILDVEKSASRQIEIHLQTDFPEGTEILVGVKRIYYQKGEKDKYSGEIFSKDIPIRNGRIDLVVDVNDTGWYTEYHRKAEKFKDLGIFSGIDRILPQIEVGALFSPRRQKSVDILNKLGKDGEYVKGKGARRSGSFTTYEVSKSLEVPFKK